MSERLFVFVQVELPFRLAVSDGRYVLRARAGGDPEHVLVVGTLGAPRRERKPGRWRRMRLRRGARAWRGGKVDAPPEAAAIPYVRATVIDPVSLSAERQAQAWLEAVDPEEEVRAAFAVVNRALFAQRIAAADPAVHAYAPGEALAIRAGWGTGQQLADGRWTHAQELHWADPRPRGRVAALRPLERFTALLGARTPALVSEELALRARADLDAGRTAHAALELDRAYATALTELRTQSAEAAGRAGAPTLARWLSELESLREGVADAAAATLEAPGVADDGSRRELLAHALARLEGALRARPAAS